MIRERFLKRLFKFHPLKESLRYAAKGIAYLFIYHRNMRIIFLSGIGAIVFGIFLKLNRFEIITLCITICVVFLAEMVNTSIELTIDIFTDKYHRLVEIIKDISAGVVLIACVNALVVAYFLFWHRIIDLFK